MPDTAAPRTLSVELVDAMRALAGPHPGFRPAHAKGIVCSGTFRATPDARRMCKAPHLQGQPVPAVIRFSNANGNPDVHDGLPGVRAMSVKFPLAGDRVRELCPQQHEKVLRRAHGKPFDRVRQDVGALAIG